MPKTSKKKFKNAPSIVSDMFFRLEETGDPRSRNAYRMDNEYHPVRSTGIRAEKKFGLNHIISFDYPEWDRDETGWSTFEQFYLLPQKVRDAWIEFIAGLEYSIYSLGCDRQGTWILERWDSSTDALFQIKTTNPDEDIVADWYDLNMHLKPVEVRSEFDILWQGLYEPRLTQIKTVFRTYKTARSHAMSRLD